MVQGFSEQSKDRGEIRSASRYGSHIGFHRILPDSVSARKSRQLTTVIGLAKFQNWRLGSKREPVGLVM